MRCWTRLIEWARRGARRRPRSTCGCRRRRPGTKRAPPGLWRDPELELGLRWRQQNRPNGPGRSATTPPSIGPPASCGAARRSTRRQVAQEESERRAKLRRAWQTARALATLLLITAVLAIYARSQQLRADEQRGRADQNLNLAKSAVDEMLSSAGQHSARVAAEVPEVEAFRGELLEKARAFYASSRGSCRTAKPCAARLPALTCGWGTSID